MSGRFEGAITGPENDVDSTVAPAPTRPRRPALIELAAAVLIVGGITDLATALVSILGPDQPAVSEAPFLTTLLLAVRILMIVTGLLVRAGRAWVLSINVVAIALFLYLTLLPSFVAIVFALLDAIVLFALFRHRDWFYWEQDQGT